MLHRLCRPPSIPLSFSLATVLPRRSVSRVSWAPDPNPIDRQTKDEHSSLTAWTTRVSDPVCSPCFRTPASVGTQRAAFAVGVPSYLLGFDPSTRNSTLPYLTQVKRYRKHPASVLATFPFHPFHRLRALYAQSFRITLAPPRLTAAAGTELAGASSSSPVMIETQRKSFTSDSALLHSRNIAGSGVSPLSNIPHCCLP